MKAYYLDASAWIKRYSDETGSEQILRLFQDGSILASATLGFVEACAALARKRDGPAAEFANAALDQVARDWPGFLRIRLTDEIVDQAAQAAVQWTLRGADAVHLASALYLQHKLEAAGGGIWFVCSDSRLLAAAERAGLQVLDPSLDRPVS